MRVKSLTVRMIVLGLSCFVLGAAISYGFMKIRLNSEWVYEAKLQDVIKSLELR